MTKTRVPKRKNGPSAVKDPEARLNPVWFGRKLDELVNKCQMFFGKRILMMLVGMFAFFPLKFPFSRFFALFVKVPNYKAAGARDGG